VRLRRSVAAWIEREDLEPARAAIASSFASGTVRRPSKPPDFRSRAMSQENIESDLALHGLTRINA